MIKPEQIPDDAATEGMKAIYQAGENLSYPALNAAIAAAINAWPGMYDASITVTDVATEKVVKVRKQFALPLHEKDG